METSELLSLIEDLEDNLDDLEENLEPLLIAALSATTKKLPVLEKAKLYALVVYSIESLLFSYLRLNGVQAKEHAVFKELTRVRQYFAKIKEAESGGVKPRENLNLNKQAAGRFIKHALAGNDKYDAERAERELKEKLLAKRKLQSLETNMRKKAKVNNDPVRAAELSEGEIDEEAPTPDTFFQPDNEAVQTSEIIEEPGQSGRPNKRRRKSRDDNSKGLEVATESEESKKARKEQKALRKQRKKETKQAAALAG